MSIKGDWGKLYVGKKEINIINIIGNKTKIKYDDISKIEYEFRSATEGGYIDFYLQYGKMKRFTFFHIEGGYIDFYLQYGKM